MLTELHESNLCLNPYLSRFQLQCYDYPSCKFVDINVVLFVSGQSSQGSCDSHFSGDWLVSAGECELSDSNDA